MPIGQLYSTSRFSRDASKKAYCEAREGNETLPLTHPEDVIEALIYTLKMAQEVLEDYAKKKES